MFADDLLRLAREIAVLKDRADDVLTLRQGEVTAHTAGPPPSLTVTLGGSSTTISGVRYLASYTPTDGDTVWMLRNGFDLVVLGKLA